MSNRWTNQPDEALWRLAGNMATVISASAGAYGVSIGQAGALSSAVTAFGDGLAEVERKKEQYRAAVEAKAGLREDLLEAMRVIAGVVYNNPAVTAEMIATTGMAVHRSKQHVILPHPPVDLIAQPDADGSVLLKWTLGANRVGADYMIETRSETGEWRLVTATRAKRIKLTGFAPGVPAWFRVYARRRGIDSEPCLPVGIYGVGVSGGLQVAA